VWRQDDPLARGLETGNRDLHIEPRQRLGFVLVVRPARQ
jgi:hypothetical protein